MSQFVYIINIRTESSDEYLKIFNKKPSITKISKLLYKHLGYDTSKELEQHLKDNTHSLKITKEEVN